MGTCGEGWARLWRAPAAPGEGNRGEQASEPNPYCGRAQARDRSPSGRRRGRCRHRCRHRGRGDQGGEVADVVGTVISRGRERLVTGGTRLARVVHDSPRSVPTMRSALPRAPLFPYSVPHRPRLTWQSYIRRIRRVCDYGVIVRHQRQPPDPSEHVISRPDGTYQARAADRRGIFGVPQGVNLGLIPPQPIDRPPSSSPSSAPGTGRLLG